MSYRDVFYTEPSGLRLYARDYPGGDGVPVLCLPGLTRNSKDFDTLAGSIAAGRRVICPDFRGRGRSAHASDPSTYRSDIELADTLALMDHLDIARVAVIGTSRGGLVGMLMAAAAPGRLAGLLLNDIGPRIEAEGLLRIRSYLGRTAPFATWDEAVASLKATNRGFDGLTGAEWHAYARRVFRETDGGPCPDYDPQLAATFPSVEDIAAGKVPELWQLYAATAQFPVTILRGANSDLLSEATLAEMLGQHPDAEAVTVPDRGHVPFLDEPPSRAAITRFLDRIG